MELVCFSRVSRLRPYTDFPSHSIRNDSRSTAFTRDTAASFFFFFPSFAPSEWNWRFLLQISAVAVFLKQVHDQLQWLSVLIFLKLKNGTEESWHKNQILQVWHWAWASGAGTAYHVWDNEGWGCGSRGPRATVSGCNTPAGACHRVQLPVPREGAEEPCVLLNLRPFTFQWRPVNVFESFESFTFQNSCWRVLKLCHFKKKTFQILKCFITKFLFIPGLPGGSAGKASACNVGDLGSIPGLGRSPGEGKGYPLQYSGLESYMDCIVHRKESDTTERLSLSFTFSL